MELASFDELAGRMDGMAQALLRLTACLEMEGLIDGPRMSDTWRQARPERLAVDRQLQASRKVLLQMAEQLDAARCQRGRSPKPAYSRGIPEYRG